MSVNLFIQTSLEILFSNFRGSRNQLHSTFQLKLSTLNNFKDGENFYEKNVKNYTIGNFFFDIQFEHTKLQCLKITLKIILRSGEGEDKLTSPKREITLLGNLYRKMSIEMRAL